MWKLAVMVAITHVLFLLASIVDPATHDIGERAVASIAGLASLALIVIWARRSLRAGLVTTVTPCYVALASAVVSVVFTVLTTFPLSSRSTTLGEPVLAVGALFIAGWMAYATRPARLEHWSRVARP